jgi:hypothetical protein
MLMQPIQPPSAAFAEHMFPSWRGREPYRDRLQALSEALFQGHAGLEKAVEALPFERFEAAHGPRKAVFKYNSVPAEAAALLDTLPEELRAPWLCALILWHIGRFEQAFAATGLPGEFELHYVDSFQRIFDQIEADPGFADASRDSFLKDLWIVRAVMIPAFAQVWWPHSGLSASAILRAGPAASSYVFFRCGGRQPFLEGHTHDPVAKAYWNEPGWREALRLAALALPALPMARGAFGTAWFYDPALKEVTPRLSFAQDLQVGRGAFRLKIGSNEGAIANATATSSDRRNRYQEGSYLPTDYAIIWSRRDLIAAHGA